MIGLTVHPSTGSGRTVKPYTVSRLKWVARIKGFAEGFVVHGLIIRLPTKAAQFQVKPFVVSLSNHDRLNRPVFDRLRANG
ncbi:hypothetical protein CRENPOLYSF1_530021 [Crenothrix polyspora]|uniref:Uncharacterized protein n=1 Tax=Crenothrix polyspora TaxID=360316 RepID=A0A1R4HDN9_9GAMM|nr:hypothetical protein CRENPOLYSF1_530021 [Crenothrix polyspora]